MNAALTSRIESHYKIVISSIGNVPILNRTLTLAPGTLAMHSVFETQANQQGYRWYGVESQDSVMTSHCRLFSQQHYRLQPALSVTAIRL